MTNALSTLASAGILGLAVLTSTPALADVDPYCSGCGGRTIPGAIENEDMTAHFDVYETTTSGQLLNCSVEFQLFLGGYATNCEGRTSACGDSVCERTYNIKMRSLSGYGDGCDGVEVNIDETNEDGEIQEVTRDPKAYEHDGDLVWGPWTWVMPNTEVSGPCGGGVQVKQVDITANFDQYGPNPTVHVPAGSSYSDSTLLVKFRCFACIPHIEDPETL